jgi:hypothetical protein
VLAQPHIHMPTVTSVYLIPRPHSITILCVKLWVVSAIIVSIVSCA